ncbi:MAG: hypothetical protein AAF989_11385 [Planctomycetota bacterium]
MFVRDKARFADVPQQLSVVSWFMPALDGPIARLAIRKDECIDRFGEGCFEYHRLFR